MAYFAIIIGLPIAVGGLSVGVGNRWVFDNGSY